MEDLNNSDMEILNLVDLNNSLTNVIEQYYENKSTTTVSSGTVNADENAEHGDEDEDEDDVPGTSDQSIDQSQLSSSRGSFASASEDFSHSTSFESQTSDALDHHTKFIQIKDSHQSVPFNIVFDNPRLTREVQLVGNLASIRIQTKSGGANPQPSSEDTQLQEKVKRLETANKELEHEVRQLKIKLSRAQETIEKLELEAANFYSELSP